MRTTSTLTLHAPANLQQSNVRPTIQADLPISTRMWPDASTPLLLQIHSRTHVLGTKITRSRAPTAYRTRVAP